MKAVKGYLQTNKPDEVETFEKAAQTFAKKVVSNFKDFEFVRALSSQIPAKVSFSCNVRWSHGFCSTLARRWTLMA